MPITSTPKIWMNGELVDWDKAQVHVLTHTLHYGTGVFEGIRAYETPNGTAIFRLTDHMKRLVNSAKILGMEIPYSVAELVQAAKDTVRSTGLPACYVRPIAYYGYGEMGLNTIPCKTEVAIACWPWGAYLGEDALEKGVRLKTSSWVRHDHNIMPPAAKATGGYINSSLAKVEALKAGYDEAVMLSPNGLIAECSGENLFAVRNDVIITPPLSAGALEGITQNSVMTIARDLGYDVRVDNLARSDLYIAEEIFVCGTAAEIGSVSSVDDREVPCPGPKTRILADLYAKAARMQDPRYARWCELVG
ncbi:MAG: branched-chain amino acid transaminase [Actinobacteria bacterium]|uniref:branched-chain-amino-acid transaminase n=1 Tax=freshwater metagenome TaxID=449393 RepID=A0A6J7TYW5_9ZZZZ|nr:branched-chain amino acid transaminase [Actinomycetota bacterium]